MSGRGDVHTIGNHFSDHALYSAATCDSRTTSIWHGTYSYHECRYGMLRVKLQLQFPAWKVELRQGGIKKLIGN